MSRGEVESETGESMEGKLFNSMVISSEVDSSDICLSILLLENKES
jgi:hypothetical protein